MIPVPKVVRVTEQRCSICQGTYGLIEDDGPVLICRPCVYEQARLALANDEIRRDPETRP